jgi:hypothetical protein
MSVTVVSLRAMSRQIIVDVTTTITRTNSVTGRWWLPDELQQVQAD